MSIAYRVYQKAMYRISFLLPRVAWEAYAPAALFRQVRGPVR